MRYYIIRGKGKQKGSNRLKKSREYLDKAAPNNLEWIKGSGLLESRVFVNNPKDFQDMLDEGKAFAFWRYDRKRRMWKSVIRVNSENAYVDGSNLVYKNHESQPLRYSGVMCEDPFNLHSFVIEIDPEEMRDFTCSQKANAMISSTYRRGTSVNPFAKGR